MNKELLWIGMVLSMLLSMVLITHAQDGGAVKVGTGDMTIGGYIHLWGTSVDDDVNLADTPDGFAVRRARFILSGHIAPKIVYRLQEELAGTSAVSRDALLKFEDVLLSGNFAINITAGQYKYPLSEAGLRWATPADELIKGPWIYEAGNGAAGTIADRDTGILVDGTAMEKKIKWYLGFFNGRTTNVAENNDQKDLLVRVTAAPFEKGSAVEGLSFGLGYMKGAQGDPAGLNSGMESRTRLVATVQHEKKLGDGILQIRFEYLSQAQEPNSANSALGWDDVKTSNWYLQLAYKMKAGLLSGEEQVLQPVIRYQKYDYDDGDLNPNDTDWEGTMTTVGTNLILSKNTRLMFNYNLIDDKTWVASEGKRVNQDNNEILLQLEVKF